MLLDDLVEKLDALFALETWPPDPTISRWLPRAYGAVALDPARILEPLFRQRFNGLMWRGARDIGEAYCAVFPSPAIIAQILGRARPGAFLFFHYPIYLDVAGTGFVPIPPATISRLKAREISAYACHAPMDWHKVTGTGAAIVEAMDGRYMQPFGQEGPGHVGRICLIEPTPLSEFEERLRSVFEVSQLMSGGARPERVECLAIVPGAGDDVELMAEAESAGAHAYVTGEWLTRTRPLDSAGRAWATRNRTACKEYAQSTRMALLGVSLGASEHLTMATQMVPYLESLDIRATAVGQADWWK